PHAFPHDVPFSWPFSWPMFSRWLMSPPMVNLLRPNKSLHLTAAAISVSRDMKPVEAAPAGELGRSALTLTTPFSLLELPFQDRCPVIPNKSILAVLADKAHPSALEHFFQ